VVVEGAEELKRLISVHRPLGALDLEDTNGTGASRSTETVEAMRAL
jgi:hypothetical protein